MKALQKRAAAMAERLRRERASKLKTIVGELLPDAEIEERGTTIQLTGPGLRKRWLTNPTLRFLGRLSS